MVAVLMTGCFSGGSAEPGSAEPEPLLFEEGGTAPLTETAAFLAVPTTDGSKLLGLAFDRRAAIPMSTYPVADGDVRRARSSLTYRGISEIDLTHAQGLALSETESRASTHVGYEVEMAFVYFLDGVPSAHPERVCCDASGRVRDACAGGFIHTVYVGSGRAWALREIEREASGDYGVIRWVGARRFLVQSESSFYENAFAVEVESTGRLCVNGPPPSEL